MVTRRVNRLLIGPPGVGKTETTEQAYEHVEKLILSSCVEEDIYGIPYREGEEERRAIPPWLVRLHAAAGAGKTTCLFLDEIDKARVEVADTLLSLVHSRETPAGLRLPEGTEIVAAANPPEFGGGSGLSIPMLNRFSVQRYEVSVEKWHRWALAKYSEYEQLVSIINSIGTGAAPLMDSVGEGLDLRVSSPRSVAYALESALAYVTGKITRQEVISDIRGLVTPRTFRAFDLGLFSGGGVDLANKASRTVRAASFATANSSGSSNTGRYNFRRPYVASSPVSGK